MLQWTAFVEAYYQQIFSFCRYMSGSATEAQDLTQEVFLKAFKAINSVEDPGALKAWVYSIARNQCNDRLRWWRRYRLFQAQNTKSEAFSSDPELKLSLARLIAQLPKQQREVFILRHWHDFSTEAVAALLKIQPGTVKSQLKRAVTFVKAELKKDLAD